MFINKKLGPISQNAIMLIIVVLAALVLTIPVISKASPHPDESQFYLNAFAIMDSKPLHNYLHIALTEYSLAGFFTLVNVFTQPGVNFPQGGPTTVTYYYGRIFGFILYILTFIFSVIIMQKRQKEIQLRTVIFAVLYFGSLAMFERFIRVNSDSFMIFVFLNFVIVSLWAHLHKPSVVEMCLLNAIFIFLGTFTNLKSLYLMFPIVLINTVAAFVWYKKSQDEELALSKIYRIILYIIAIIAICLALWRVLAPKPFDSIRFWYTLKNTIIHGTEFDFDYPGQSFRGWFVYLYDLVVFQIGVIPLGFVLFLLIVAFYTKGKSVATYLWEETKRNLQPTVLKSGQLYKATELVLFSSFISYYIGISLKIVHWSRWNAPLGILAMMVLSSIIEKVIKYLFDISSSKYRYVIPIFPCALLFMWTMRIALTIDLYTSGYGTKEDFYLTRLDIEKLLQEKNIKLSEAKDKVSWFTGYTANVSNFSFEQIIEPKNQNVEYILWPEWNAGLLYTINNVDKSTHNQRAFVDKYVENIEYRFPTILARYIYRTRQIAWSVFGITWIPELDSIVEPYYAVLKIKKPITSISLDYTVPSKDLSYYESPYSRTFNLQTLKDSYVFAPCYSYQAVRRVFDGNFVMAPPELSPFGKTAGLYCHSLRFRVIPKGVYALRIKGLPKDTIDQQMLYYNFGDFSWDPVNKVAVFSLSDTQITGEFGVATKEQNLPDLEFEIIYNLDQDMLKQIEKIKAKEAEIAAEMAKQQTPQP